MNGLDLFSGIGGISLALEPWVRTVAYCESDKYAQAVLISRMAEGKLHKAPIWDDVRTLDGSQLKGSVDIIFGGFPCQNISCAGRGEGLEGERSGLFGEIVRLAQEIRPAFIFLENVPAIRTRGLPQVIRELASIRFDARWGCLSAFDVGAPHKRERWFCLARNADRNGKSRRTVDAEMAKLCGDVPDSSGAGRRQITRSIRKDEGEHARWSQKHGNESIGVCEDVSDSESGAFGSGKPRSKQRASMAHSPRARWAEGGTVSGRHASSGCWWSTEPDVGRVANGIPKRVDRLRCLGNAVVPAQAREAFRRLMGL